MVLTFDIMHGCGQSNKMSPRLLPKKTVIVANNNYNNKKHYAHCMLLTKRSTLVFKLDVPYRLQRIGL